MVAADDVQRQVTTVVPVEETPLLVAVQRIVGAVEVQEDLLRGGASRNRSTISSSIASMSAFLYRSGSPGTPNSSRFRVFKPASGWPRSRSRTRFSPVRSSRSTASASELSSRSSSWSLRSSYPNTEQPLGDQLPHRMLDPPLAPVVLETSRQPRRQVEQPVGLAQQQRAAVGAEPAAIADHLAVEPLALFVTFWDTCSIQMYRIFFTPIQVRKTANPPCRERRFRRFHPKPLRERPRHGPGSPRVRRAAPGHIRFLFRIRPPARPLRICRRAAGAIRGSPSGRQPTKNGTAQTPPVSEGLKLKLQRFTVW